MTLLRWSTTTRQVANWTKDYPRAYVARYRVDNRTRWTVYVGTIEADSNYALGDHPCFYRRPDGKLRGCRTIQEGKDALEAMLADAVEHYAALRPSPPPRPGKPDAIAVAEMRAAYAQGGQTQSALAAHYNISQAQVSRILANQQHKIK